VQNRDVLNYDGMDELSQAFAQAFVSTFPQWEQLAKAVKDEKTRVSYIEVDVGQEGTDRVLHLSTADNEITIGFDNWHTHIGPFLGSDTAESVAEAIAIIESFIAEETIVKVSRRDGVWIESNFEYLVAPSEPKPNSTAQVFSWRRTHDKTIDTR